MARPRAADDFAAIRARMEELRRERLQAERDKALRVSESPRYPRNRKPESDPASQKLGCFAFQPFAAALRPQFSYGAARAVPRIILVSNPRS